MTDTRMPAVLAGHTGAVRQAAVLTAAATGGVIGWRADGYTWWLLLVAAMSAGLAQQALP